MTHKLDEPTAGDVVILTTDFGASSALSFFVVRGFSSIDSAFVIVIGRQGWTSIPAFHLRVVTDPQIQELVRTYIKQEKEGE